MSLQSLGKDEREDVIRAALSMYMCLLETGDPLLSAQDARERKLYHIIKPLNMKALIRVNAIRNEIGLLPYGEDI